MKTAIIGTGMISDLFLKNARLLPFYECYAVYNRQLEKAAAFQKKYALAQAYDDYEELLNDPQIDCVYIALPNSLHYHYAYRAAECGKKIIIEKPFVSNYREFEQLQAVCLKNKVKIAEVNRVLSLPNYQIIREKLALCRDLAIVSATFFQSSRKYAAFLNGEQPNVFSTKFSGGALMDLGVYGTHFVIGLFGLPLNVYYRAKQTSETLDLAGVLILEYPHFIAVLLQSKISFGDNRILIQGDGAKITVDAPASHLNVVTVTEKNKVPVSFNAQAADNFYYALKDIQRSFSDEQHYLARIKQSSAVMKVLDAARSSAGIKFSADREL